MDNHKFVSVIIPTYKDTDLLKLCINGLKKQSYPSNLFEVIIINNDPNNESLDVDANLPKNFNIISEKKIGSYAARNTGIINSKGQILAFTDADCIPREDWILNAVELIQKGAQRVAGRVQLFYKSNNLTPSENYEKVYAFDQRENAIKGKSVTANMITLKKYFNDIGMFDERLFSGGDMEWSLRAFRNKISIRYAHNVIVDHPARANIRELIKKAKRVSYNSTEKDSLIKIIIKGFVPSPHSLIKPFRCKEVSFANKINALLIYYYLKLIKMVEQISVRWR
tara:strand:+ start:333 stop:1178 length:846 start_codon:yes stop_codon:yes gene_type:complete